MSSTPRSTVPTTWVTATRVPPAPIAAFTVSTGMSRARAASAESRPARVATVAPVRKPVPPESVTVSTRAAGPESSAATAASVAA